MCLAQNLSLSLKISFFFPDQIEFVGRDVCANGTMPAKSESNLLKTWPNFKIVYDIASFVGSILFYAQCTPHVELYMSKLREVMKLTYESQVDEIDTQEAYKEWDDSMHYLIADQCIACYDPDLRFYLWMDSSSFGFGYSLN